MHAAKNGDEGLLKQLIAAKANPSAFGKVSDRSCTRLSYPSGYWVYQFEFVVISVILGREELNRNNSDSTVTLRARNLQSDHNLHERHALSARSGAAVRKRRHCRESPGSPAGSNRVLACVKL
jgi:hypothetical protein